MVLNVRTDLASEALDRIFKSGLPEGINAESENIEGFECFHVRVADKQAGELIGKAAGEYYTLKLNKLPRGFDEEFEGAVSAVSSLIMRVLPSPADSFLVAALGNPDITPDALGPLCAEHILVTRHLLGSPEFKRFKSTAVLRTGVLGTTGIESAMQINALCSLIMPDAVIVVDALAGADISGLCRSIQISTGGISPGSGVLNNRAEISSSFLNTPVISIGVPTVADGSNFLDSSAEDMFLTPRDIDIAVRSCAKVIAYGINTAIHPGLSVYDVRELSE